MDFLYGEDRILFIKEDGVFKPVGCLTSNNIEESVEILPTTTRTQNGWRTGIPTNQEFSIPFQGLQILTLSGNHTDFIGYDKLKIKKRAREKIEWRIASSSNSLIDSGFGHITFIGEGNQVDEFLTFSGLIIGYGEPTFTQTTGDQYQDGTVMSFQDGTPITF